MPHLTLFEMLRLGGFGAYFSFGLGVVLLLLTVVGFVLAAGKKRAAVKGWWSWVVLILGLLAAFNGFLGTIMGLANVNRAAMTACPCDSGPGCAGPGDVGTYAQGVFEVLFCVAFGVFTPFLAIFGHAMVKRAAHARK